MTEQQRNPRTPVDQLPAVTQTQYWTYTSKARQDFLSYTKPYTCRLAPADQQYRCASDNKLTLAGYLDHMAREERHYVHHLMPRNLRNARDMATPYAKLGNDTKVIRTRFLSCYDRLKNVQYGSLQELYDAWVKDFVQRDVPAFVRKEMSMYENMARDARVPIDPGLLREIEWAEEENHYLDEVLKRLHELREWDKFGLPKESTKRPLVTVHVNDLPEVTATQFFTYSPNTIREYKDTTMPYHTKLIKDDQEYKVTHFTKQEYLGYLKDRTILLDARPDILQNAKNHAKPYSELGIDTAKLRIWLMSGIERLEATSETSLDAIYKQWVADLLAREQVQYVRETMSMLEHYLNTDKKGGAAPPLLREINWAEEEGRFLQAVVERLNEIRNLNDPLLHKEEEEKRQALRREQEKEREAKRKAEEAAKQAELQRKKEEEERQKKQREEEQKQREEEQKKQLDATLASAQQQVMDTQTKMALYQKELAELQGKMMRQEIDGAAFGAAVGALSKKYFS